MLFSSLVFLFVYLPVTLLLYHILPSMRTKNFVLMLLSLFFYAWGEPLYVFLMVAIAFVDYLAALVMHKLRGKRSATAVLVIVVALNLASLGVFKYLNFIVDNINAVTGLSIPLTRIVLPIGISFYIFQALSYMVDVYRGDVAVQRKFSDFLLFVSLFPQLIAGPILRYGDIDEQIVKRDHTMSLTARGTVRFVAGLGKKILIANYCSAVVERLLNGAGAPSVLGAWLGIIMYAFQIYFDFSGYSDMAIGLGHMFGFNYPENFKYPYVAKSITEFWRRWHISLSTLFREYVYIPMGGNRLGLPRQMLNMLVVWALTGLWHGASWNFVIWGLWFFLLLLIEKQLGEKRLSHIPSPLRILCTFLLVLVGWVFFYFTDMGDGWRFLGTAVGLGSALIDDASRLALINSIPLLVISLVGVTPIPATIARRLRRDCERGNASAVMYALPATLFVLCVFSLCVVSLVSSTHNPFIYFRF